MIRTPRAARFAPLLALLILLASGGCPGPEPQLARGDGGTTGGSGGATGGGGGTAGTGGSGGSGGGAACDCDKVDIVLVIDNTDSMSDFVAELPGALLQLVGKLEALTDRVCSFHLGVVTAVPQVGGQQPIECQVLGALSRVKSDGTLCDMDNGIYLTEADRAELFQDLLCLVVPGAQNDGNERPIEALTTALSAPLNATGGCNEGFFRADASLLVAIIGDRDDTDSFGGATQPAQWYADLVALNLNDASKVASFGLIGPTIVDAGCSAEAAPRLHQFFNEHPLDNQATENICSLSSADLETSMERMAEAACPASGG